MIDWVRLLWASGFLAAGVGALVVLGLGFLAAHRWTASREAKATVHQLVYGPIVTAILGFGVYRLFRFYPGAGGPTLPTFLSPGDILFLVELAVLSSATGAAAAATRRHVPRHRFPGGHILTYGVYAASMLVLAAIVLTAPQTPRFGALTWQLLGFATGILATYFVVHITDLSLRRYLDALAEKEPGFRTVYSFLRRLTLTTIALIGVAVTGFASFPDLTAGFASIVLAAGFISIVVGLAAQTSISNVIAGMLLSLTQPFRIGDAVVFGNEYCFVEDIRLTFSVLRVWDNRRLMVPNSQFMNQFVINYTAVDATMLVPLVVRVTLDSDMPRAMEIMRDEAARHPDCRPIGNLPNVVVMDYTEFGAELRVLSRAVDQGTAFQMERDLLASIRARFEAEGIRLAVPYRELRPVPAADAPKRRPGGRGAAARPADAPPS